ncbi:MAG: hypothetical protein HC917_24960 [Richelia sp. SM2_1_7]|nr:hypothetical protein [Richelia sp. SM2_1_7]
MEEAHSIELIQFEENAFEVVVQKNLYNIEDKAVYIQPDYCLSDIELFKTFIESGKLGSNNRIKAIKFNFSTEINSSSKTYSNGILLPIYVVEDWIGTTLEINNLANTLGITKYEEPEKNNGGVKSGLTKGSLPQGMYKTDETNIKNIINQITYPIEFVGTLKIDGSSCSIYYKSEEEYGICSRNQEKKLDQKQIVGYEKFKRHYNKDTKEKGWIDEDNLFYNQNNIDDLQKEGLVVPIYDELYDDFIELGKPILEKLINYCKENNKQLVLRGEIAGKSLKGSGNKHNPHSKLEKTFYLFGIDDYSSGVAIPLSYNEYVTIFTEMNLTVCPIIIHKIFSSFEEIKQECKEYFNEHLVEGIVLRTLDSKFSCKFMNDEYDEKK